jgi:hypothetical protein
MNIYGKLSEFKSLIQTTATDRDDVLLLMLESASRYVDDYCNRYFYTRTGTGVGAACDGYCWIPDAITITEVSYGYDLDSMDDILTEYTLYPTGTYPKQKIISASLRHGMYVQVAGELGYGNGSMTPWLDTGLTASVEGATGTTISITGENLLERGQTILVDTEQMYVTAVSAESVAVERGVNGTTAAAHDKAEVYVARYPIRITTATYYKAQSAITAIGAANLHMRMIGNYQEMFRIPATENQVDVALLGPYRRT